MIDPTRREFMITAGTALAAGSLVQTRSSTASEREPSAAEPIPPHRSLTPHGVHLYTDRPSYAAGETLTAYLSATAPCTIEVVRLGDDLDSPVGDEVLHSLEIERPMAQPLHPGSYIHIERALPIRPPSALTLECWLRPWNLHEPQGVVTQLDGAAGFALLLFPDGTLGFFSGECEAPAETLHRTQAKLELPGKPTFDAFVTPPGVWRHVAAVYAEGRKSIWLDGRLVGEWDARQPLVPADAPLRIGALGRDGEAAGFLDADIAMPAVYGRALSELEIRTRHAQRGLKPPEIEPALWGCWPLTEERGDTVADLSGAERTGRIVNHATWMIGGPSFLPAVARYRPDYDPDRDATRGHGLRLASDDLYDCRWQPTLRFALPANSPPGLYAVRGRFVQDDQPRMTHAVFVVRRPADAERAPVALLYSTNTWKAYSGAPFAPAWPGVFANVGNKGYQPKPTDPLAAYCFYRFHRAGQPTYQLGWRMPWPAASPYALASAPEVGYGHLSRADRFTQEWLQRRGYRFDALSDLDLHQNPDALAGVKALFIVGHSEYWTSEAMRRVREFLDRGGNVICLSGNTMYWRVSQSDEGEILECRKADAWGAQLADYMRGECWHEHDRRRGGVPRDCGDAEWRTLGVEFASAGAMTATSGGAFHAVDASHRFFHDPRETGLNNGDRFAFDRERPGRQPIGHECDVRISTLLDFTRRLPPIAGMPTDLADPEGIRLLAVGRFNSDGTQGAIRDYAHRVLPAALRKPEDSLCDIVHWQRSGGGQVFAAPSISAGWTLAACPQWSAMLQNALDSFGVKSEG